MNVANKYWNVGEPWCSLFTRERQGTNLGRVKMRNPTELKREDTDSHFLPKGFTF